MELDRAARRELTLKVLGWGTVVYFLITGFALHQHALFELRAAPGAARLQQARRRALERFRNTTSGPRARRQGDGAAL